MHLDSGNPKFMYTMESTEHPEIRQILEETSAEKDLGVLRNR